jgi:hypothetical protein
MRAQGQQLSEITSLIESGVIRPVVDKVFPFERSAEALAYVEHRACEGQGRRRSETRRCQHCDAITPPMINKVFPFEHTKEALASLGKGWPKGSALSG